MGQRTKPQQVKRDADSARAEKRRAIFNQSKALNKLNQRVRGEIRHRNREKARQTRINVRKRTQPPIRRSRRKDKESRRSAQTTWAESRENSRQRQVKRTLLAPPPPPHPPPKSLERREVMTVPRRRTNLSTKKHDHFTGALANR